MPPYAKNVSAESASTKARLKQDLHSNLNTLFHELFKYRRKVIRRENLTFGQAIMLNYIHDADPVGISSVAGLASASKSAMTGAIDTLEKRGFVQRVHDTTDRRRINLVLTDKSIRLIDELKLDSSTVIDEVVQSLSENSLTALNDALRRATEKFSAREVE